MDSKGYSAIYWAIVGRENALVATIRLLRTRGADPTAKTMQSAFGLKSPIDSLDDIPRFRRSVLSSPACCDRAGRSPGHRQRTAPNYRASLRITAVDPRHRSADQSPSGVNIRPARPRIIRPGWSFIARIIVVLLDYEHIRHVERRMSARQLPTFGAVAPRCRS
jgi:hypothetical protein